MNKIKTMLVGVSTLLASALMTTPSVAGASDFAGPYIAIQASVNGCKHQFTLTGIHFTKTLHQCSSNFFWQKGVSSR